MLTLVSYDVTSDARRERVANALLDHGQRVQYSVFECWLDARELAGLRERLSALIDGTVDSVRVYTICAECERRVDVWGVGAYRRQGGAVIV